MSIKCQCERAGFCERRQCHVNVVHWDQCQRGMVELVDKKCELIKNAREARKKNPQPIKIHDDTRLTPFAGDIPRKPPRWVKLLAMIQRSDDVGPGDTFEHLAHTIGADKAAHWLEDKGFIDDCGCPARKGRWNKQWNYEYWGLKRKGFSWFLRKKENFSE